MTEILSHHSGQPMEQVEQDLDRDYFMTAEEAVEWGLIDDILVPRRGVSAPKVAAAS
jgi:ATP-dependent Clp protease protease subunit